MFDDPKLALVIGVVASDLVRHAVEEYVVDCWEDYPNIGQYDMERVVAKAKELLPPAPRSALMSHCLAFLEARAEKEL